MNQQNSFQTIYEYKIAGGDRRPCLTEDDYLEGFEDRCSNASGFRVLSEGTLVKFYQFLDRKEIQYNVGYYDEKHLGVFLKRIDEIIKTDAPLEDLNEGAPICMDAPIVTQAISNDQQQEFIIAKRQDCHEFARGDDLNATKLANMMERLYRRMVTIAAPAKHILMEKHMQIGFRPMGMPGDILVRIYSDGRVIKRSEYNEHQITTQLIAILSAKEINDLSQNLGQISRNSLKIEDLNQNDPVCTDAPTISYSMYEEVLRPCPPPPPGSSEPDSCGGEYLPFVFAKQVQCHSIMDPSFIQQSKDLIKFMSQFN